MRGLVAIAYGAVFLGLVADLTALPKAGREQVRTHAESFRLRTDGRLDLQRPEGQGLALLRQASGA